MKSMNEFVWFSEFLINLNNVQLNNIIDIYIEEVF